MVKNEQHPTAWERFLPKALTANVIEKWLNQPTAESAERWLHGKEYVIFKPEFTGPSAHIIKRAHSLLSNLTLMDGNNIEEAGIHVSRGKYGNISISEYIKPNFPLTIPENFKKVKASLGEITQEVLPEWLKEQLGDTELSHVIRVNLVIDKNSHTYYSNQADKNVPGRTIFYPEVGKKIISVSRDEAITSLVNETSAVRSSGNYVEIIKDMDEDDLASLDEVFTVFDRKISLLSNAA